MLVDAITGASIAGGVVTAAQAEAALADENTFVLTRAMLERGLNSDLRDIPGPRPSSAAARTKWRSFCGRPASTSKSRARPDYSI